MICGFYHGRESSPGLDFPNKTDFENRIANEVQAGRFPGVAGRFHKQSDERIDQKTYVCND
jgi:hypothetical protein